MSGWLQAPLGYRWRQFWLLLLTALLWMSIGVGSSIWLGQDANWDLRNYHLYDGYAALHDRYDSDLAAAGLQSWINPALDIPYAWLALGPLSERPKFLAAFMGLWYGLLISVIFAYAVSLYHKWPTKIRWFAITAATTLAATGAAVFSQVGTTYNEIQTSALVLAAGLLLARYVDREGNEPPHAVLLLFAGGLLGGATGLKITNAIYAIAACLALVVSIRPHRWLRCWIYLAVGGVVGLIASGGWWFWTLWQRFGNPTFPFFNDVFRSPWYPSVNFLDRRFLPHGFWQALLYPFYWLGNKPMLVTEVPFRDGRIAVSFALSVLLIAIFSFGRVRKAIRKGTECVSVAPSVNPAQRFLLAFLVISYLFWLMTTCILRYAIPVEVSAALALPLLLWLLVKPSLNWTRSAIWTALLPAISLALLLSTHYPGWGRMAYGNQVVSADMRWLPPNSLVVLVGATVSCVVPFAPARPGISFVGLTDVVLDARGYELADEVVARIKGHQGPIVLIWHPDEQWRLPTLQDMGLVLIPGTCRTFPTSYETSSAQWFHACEGKKQVARILVNPFWKQATEHYDEIEVPEPTPGWSYLGFVQAVGNSAHGKKFVDDYEYIWSREPDRPKKFDDKILLRTLYILHPSLKSRALRAMNKSTDVLAEVDGILVLAPGWKNCTSCTTTPIDQIDVAN